MLNDTEKQKIKGFVADKMMSNAVKNVLMDRFLKGDDILNSSIQMLAGQRVAQILLNEGWRDLQKYAKQTEQETKNREQIGL